MLESQNHEHSFFSTFTYEVEPDGQTLVKEHITSTMHRLRDRARQISRSVRFFAVGEYGEITHRPHYHAAIFGLRPEHQQLITESWSSLDCVESGAKPGMVDHRHLSLQFAQYIAGYVTKKLTDPADERLDGRAPEFSVMSRRPGIGMPALVSIIECLNTSWGAAYIGRHKDVPVAFSCGARVLPLGSYMRSKLRTYFFGDHRQPACAKEHRRETHEAEVYGHLPPLPIDAALFDRIEAMAIYHQTKEEYLKAQSMKRAQRARQVAKRHAIHQSMRKI